MTVFEHSFTLIGLVLGLALADVLSGLIRAVRARGLRSLGLLTPMLAVFVLLDVTTFWGIVWDARSMLTSIWPVLGVSLVLSGMYYIAASLVLPDSFEKWPDLDVYYMKHRRLVLGLMLLCFLIVVAFLTVMRGAFTTDIVGISYIIVLALTWLAPWKRSQITGLGTLILVDVWAFTPAA